MNQASQSNGPLEVVSNLPVEAVGTELPANPLPTLTAEELMDKINGLGLHLRECIVQAKRLPRVPGLEPYEDATRSIALAQAHLQTGFMWLRRAVECPKQF